MQLILIDNKTGVGTTEFPLGVSGKGRLTIEKPSILESSHLPARVELDIPLEDTHEYNVSVEGRGASLSLVPAGFRSGVAQVISELGVTFETIDTGSADGGVPDAGAAQKAIRTIVTLTVPLVPEFFVRETPATGAAPTPKGVFPEPFRPVAHFSPARLPISAR